MRRQPEEGGGSAVGGGRGWRGSRRRGRRGSGDEEGRRAKRVVRGRRGTERRGRESFFLCGPHSRLHSTVKFVANIILRCSWGYVADEVRQNVLPHC